MTNNSSSGEIRSPGDNIILQTTKWTFGGGTPSNFDVHVRKSIPLYAEGHSLIADLAMHFAPAEGKVIDVGCSTGTLLALMAERLRDGPDSFLGFDIEPDMIKAARERCKEFDRVKIYAGDASSINYKGSHIVVMYYTLQFVHPQHRPNVLRKVHQGLNKGGALFLFEKTLAENARLQEIADQQYIDFKRKNGFSLDEIYDKSLSLRAVLYPHSTNEIMQQLAEAGFGDVMVIQKYLNFAGMLAVK